MLLDLFPKEDIPNRTAGDPGAGLGSADCNLRLSTNDGVDCP